MAYRHTALQQLGFLTARRRVVWFEVEEGFERGEDDEEQAGDVGGVGGVGGAGAGDAGLWGAGGELAGPGREDVLEHGAAGLP